MVQALRSRAAIVACALAVLFVATSCINGPIAGTPQLGADSFLAQVGYQQSEFFMSGLADAYTPTAALTNDGKWSVQRDAANSGVGFNTRIVVRRPVDPAKFNGTVVVEWLNVSAGADLPTDWIAAHNELIRTGTAYVGVSAQSVGVEQLKTCCNGRYTSLRHPGDSYSYDIFSWAAREIRNNPKVLNGLTPQRLLAAGESQSAGRMVTYIDAVQPLLHLYDGFLVHSRGASGAPLSQAPLTQVSTPSPSLIRDDLDQPVFVVQSEDDVIRSNTAARQPDTAKFREWEMAGTAHADRYTSTVGFTDPFDGTGAVRMLGYMRDPGPAGPCGKPWNAGPSHWILQAAYHGLDQWVRNGTLPASGPLLQTDSTSPTVLSRDQFGIAKGGVRSPQVDAPIATVDGVNTGPGFCLLFGSTTPFTPEQLAQLYPTHADFVNAWNASLSAQFAGGFLLAPDVYELGNAAAAAPIPS
jgi:hypothetical protein